MDNAATTQKPRAVLEAMDNFYNQHYANVHRGVHRLTAEATAAYEAARLTLAQFIQADPEECVFVRGVTEGINLVAHCMTETIAPGQEILISVCSHHSNLVPWQQLCQRQGAHLKVIPLTAEGTLDLNAFKTALEGNVAFVALPHISNVLGMPLPLTEIIKLVRAKDLPILIDGAQAPSHIPVDVKALDCDFYVFSAHKMYGPTGVGLLYAKKPWLDFFPVYQTGGEMIETVTFEHTTFRAPPHKFEAGTPAIAEVIGFAAAAQYLLQLGYPAISQHETDLTLCLHDTLSNIPTLTPLSVSPLPLCSFNLEDLHPHDVGTVLDQYGFCVRTGDHCAQPLHQWLNQPQGSVRVSLGLYNTEPEIIALGEALKTTLRFFKA